MAVTKYPEGEELFDSSITSQTEELCELVSAIRNIRTEKQIPPSRRIDVSLKPFSEKSTLLIEENINEIKTLAKISSFSFGEHSNSETALTSVVKLGKVFVLNIETKIDKKKEIEKLSNELKKIIAEKERFENKLNNPNFIERAPKEVIEKHKEILSNFEKKEKEIKEVLEKLST